MTKLTTTKSKKHILPEEHPTIDHSRLKSRWHLKLKGIAKGHRTMEAT